MVSPARAIELLGKAVRKPPHVVADRALAELRRQWESYRIPRIGSGLSFEQLLNDLGVDSLSALQMRIAEQPFVARWGALDAASLDALSADETARLRGRAEEALGRRIDLLGSGPIVLGDEIDWHRDYKSGDRWPPRFFGDITYGDPTSASDVKIPWEISRLQWLIPVAQMYVLSGEERYAVAVREVLEQWMTGNSYGASVNWTCTMEVALRIVTWTFFHHALRRSDAWADPVFSRRFLHALYEHGHFVAGHLEFSDVNGNHYTADAAGLVFAGLFFGGTGRSRSWQARGWKILEAELPRQVSVDGPDFEASVPYHRFVLELFILPALYRERRGLPVSAAYRARVTSMAQFVCAYTPDSGLAPLLGDADDARTLPFGTQRLNDHRYLVGCVAVAWGAADLRASFSGSRAEIAWLFGSPKANTLPGPDATPSRPVSAAFPNAGYYLMRSGSNHVFIDCAPVGLSGRGGHGHNDCLSFTATIDGTPLVVDCGAYVYTASYSERNHFRSTGVHNTPQVDGEEINRFISPTHLWNLHYDAVPSVRRWSVSGEQDLFIGTHAGYRRLSSPVEPVRTIILDKRSPALLVSDILEGSGRHTTCVPWYLDANVRATVVCPGRIVLSVDDRRFVVSWHGEDWSACKEAARVSPSYGTVMASSRIVWRHEGETGKRLTVLLHDERLEVDFDGHVGEIFGRAGLAWPDRAVAHA